MVRDKVSGSWKHMAHSRDTSEREWIQGSYGLGYAKSGIRNEFNAPVAHRDGKIKL